RERDSQWTLVRWRNNCEAPLRRTLNDKTSIEALTVNRDWDNRRANLCKRLACAKIAGILEPNDISRCQQRSGDQTQCTLASCRNEYFCRGASNAACNGQVPGNRLTQRRVHGRVLRNHCNFGKAPGPARDETGPELSRKRIQRRQAHLKWTHRRRVGRCIPRL